MQPGVRSEIENLRRLSIEQLRQRHRELFGEDSGCSNRMHLLRRVAWRLQAQAQGDLSQRASARAAQLAQDTDLRMQAPRNFWKDLDTPERSPGRDARLPAVGSSLTRSYQGRSVTVWIREKGFECHGRMYGSLSAIAYQVTGTRWNGFLFFGLGSGSGAAGQAS